MPIISDGDVYEKTYSVQTLDVAVIPELGCEVKVEYYSGADWREDGQSPVTSVDMVTVRGLQVRFTASGGAANIADGSIKQ